MRIVLVCPYDLRVPGGVQAHVGDLARTLREGGDRVRVVAPGASRLTDGWEVGATVRIPFNGSVAPLALSPAAARRTAAGCRSWQADVVHVHEPAVPAVSAAAVARAPAPLVGTYHAWADRPGLYRLARPVTARLHRRLAAAVAVSSAARDYHARALGVPPASLEVVPNGVDVDAYARAPADPDRADAPGHRLLFLGRLESRKGLAELLEAYTRLKASHPDLRLVVAGDGPERERCAGLLAPRLRADVEFLGFVVDEDKRRLLQSCDLLVAPSLRGESFGIVLVEALAAGLPVVASDLPGYRTVITDGSDGRLVPPGDVSALTAAIETLLEDPALARGLAQQGRRTVRDYDWSVVAGRLRAIYAEVA